MATPTAADPTGMIRAKDLHALLKQHVDDQGGSGGAMLTTGEIGFVTRAGALAPPNCESPHTLTKPA